MSLFIFNLSPTFIYLLLWIQTSTWRSSSTLGQFHPILTTSHSRPVVDKQSSYDVHTVAKADQCEHTLRHTPFH